MAGRIPEGFIQDLLARTDLVELVNQRVQLKKSGRNYMACCPFHQEKTPSFTVAPEKQFYYCFGCGASGNAIGFLMEYEHQGFPQAVEQLASISGLEVPREQVSPQQQARLSKLEQLYRVLERADQYYRRQLRSAPEKDVAIRYLKNRGLSGQIAARYGLGFAPPGFENLLTALSLDQEGMSNAIEAGLLIRREDTGRVYDKFRDRIMFPIRDTRGRIIGFGGRVLGDGKPKYLNSPETPVFHKSKELYGLWEIRQARLSPEKLFVVEGYMDVIALAQHGIENAVATLGTATSEDHVHKLFQHVDEIVFCFDGDEAGRRAAWRGLENTLAKLEDGKQARFLFLPEGEDPDSMVRNKGPEHLLALANHAPTLADYFLEHLSEGLNLDTVEGRARLAQLALPYLPKIKGIALQSLLRQELSARTRLDRQDLERMEQAQTEKQQAYRRPEPPTTPNPEHLDSSRPPDEWQDVPPPEEYPADRSPLPPGAPPAVDDFLQETPSRHRHLTLVEKIIVMMLHRPELPEEHPLPTGIEQLELPWLGLLQQIANYLKQHREAPPAVLISGIMALAEGEHLTHMLNQCERIEEDETATASWLDALAKLKIQLLEKQIRILERASNPDLPELARLLGELEQARNELHSRTL